MNSWLFWRLLTLRSRGIPMTWLTMAGMAIGVATLVVTLAIIDGFAEAYQRGMIRFNAPILLFRHDETIDRAAVDAAITPLRIDHVTAGTSGIETVRWIARLRDLWWWGNWQYTRSTWSLRTWPGVGPMVTALSPRQIVEQWHLPKWLEAWRTQQHAEWRASVYRGITTVTPFLYREGLLLGQGAIRGVVLRGVIPADMERLHALHLDLGRQPSLVSALAVPADDDRLRLVLGSVLARQLGNTGVRLYLPTETPSTTTPPDQAGELIPVHVVGTFTSGIYEFDAQSAFVDLAALQRFYRVPEVITGYEIDVDHLVKTPWMSEYLQGQLGSDYIVRDWRETHRETFEAVALEKILFAMIMGILVIVAAVNIVTTMLLRVIGRYRSIAVLHAMGMSQRSVQRGIFWQGVLLGGCGLVAGVAIGAGLAWGIGHSAWIRIPAEVYFLSTVPTRLSGVTLVAIVLFGGGMVGLAARHAARRARTLPILEALGRGYL
ncbi:MAG: ABC transporter permease [Deltaproteobacteria bacterium]|nr:ABC transporter permease [Deltaproteobacteria bacterium]